MTDEEKPAGKKVEETKQPAPQTSEQQKPPAIMGAALAAVVASEGETSDTAVTNKVNRSTEKLKVGDMAGMPQALPLSFGGEPGSAKWFKRLPVSMSTSELPPETPRWRVELIGLGPTVEPMGLEVVGDTVIGRGRVGTEPADLDLDMYGALEKGVSRRHGLFRPTTNHLYIIDLGSTNGTLHNGIPLGPGVARALKHNDTITLGRFSFTIKIVDGPTIRKAAEPERLVVAASDEDAEQTKPLKVMDVSEVKAKKARLAPPTFDPSSPETAKLSSDEAVAENQPQPSAVEANGLPQEDKPPAAIVESPIQQAGLLKAEGQPSALEIKLPVSEAKTPVAESEAPSPEAKPSTKEVQPPTHEAKPAADEAKPPVDEAKPAADEAKLPTVGGTSPADEKNPDKRASLLGE